MLEIIGTALGLLYLYLEYKASIWLWIAGIAMPAVYVFVYFHAGLYADFAINVYYLLASVYGLVCWGLGRGGKGDEQSITYTPRRLYVPLVVVTAVLTVLIAVVLVRFTDSTVPWADGFTTALSITAMWMLAKKQLEQWIAWIGVDLVSSALLVYKGLFFTAALYGLYAVAAVFGYLNWKKLMRNDKD